MKITYYPRPALLGWLVLILALLLGGACVPQEMVVSPLGMVVGGGRGYPDPVAGGADGDWGTGDSEAAGVGDGAGGLWADRGA